MKEIDFIPQWYRAGRERKRRYVRHYALMAALFSLLVGWTFIINGHVARVSAEVEDIQTAFEKGQLRSEQAVRLENQIAEMEEKTMLLDTIAPRTKVTAILGELSWLIGENVILSSLLLQDEVIRDTQKADQFSAAIVRVGSSQKKDQNEAIPQSPSHCKVVLTGIAARPADAASLIARLEKTDYFDRVFLVYSKPKKVKDKNVTEFEVRCFVSDYTL